MIWRLGLCEWAWRPWTVALSVLVLASACGCSDRVMTITRDDHINTVFDPSGSPLSVDIVSVLPNDLKGDKLELNRLLLPEGGITSDVWFDHKPTKESMQDPPSHPDRFCIHRDQILSFTDEPKQDVYGRVVGGQIQGKAYAKKHGEEKIVVPRVLARDIFDEHAVIYVFCKFTNASGEVQRTNPAMFHSVGDYRREIAVHIGQTSIERTSKRVYGRDVTTEGSQD
ncbi:MAG: hypothetical protein JXQ75_02155 [Phycisphaerae bacterium]|nr:hypothetical protein [Phycisphaerae bacterium]